MKHLVSALSILTLATVFTACSGQETATEEQPPLGQKSSATQSNSYPLMMGRTDQMVGTVTVSNDDTEVCVQYDTLNGYELQDAHLCVQASQFDSRVPPGQCRFTEDPLPADATTWRQCFPISDYIDGDFCNQMIFMQAHASIADAESDVNVGSAYGVTFLGSYPYTLVCEDPPPPEYPGCTYTQGFWKNHAKAWPVKTLELGGVEYSQRILIGLLKLPPKGDASIILAHQLIAAKLNLLRGAVPHPDVAFAVSEADLWMTQNADADGKLPYGTEPGSAAHVRATKLTEVLDQFNNGWYGPEHCEEPVEKK